MGWEKYQFKHGFLDQMTIAQAGLWALENNNDKLPNALRYRCVLVDEYQDFSTEELKFISKIPTATENGIFLTGDAGQKIFAKDFDLPKAGFGPNERDRRDIRKNYRNSRQILEAAHELLEAYSSEGTAKLEGITILKPEYAVRLSAKPFAVDHEDQILCAWAQAEEWIKGCPAYAVAIVTADEKNTPVSEIIANRPKGRNANELTGDIQQDKESVIVSDLNSIKGFEFSLVIIVGLSQGQLPSRGTAKGELWRDALRLYVAMTRARDELVLIYSNEPSEFLKVMAKKLSQREVITEAIEHRGLDIEKSLDISSSKEPDGEESKEADTRIEPILPSPQNNTTSDKKEPEEGGTGRELQPRQTALVLNDRSVSSSINGSRIIKIPTPSTVEAAAKHLNTKPERLLEIMRVEWQEYLQPHHRLHDGYITKLVEHIYGWKCTPIFVPSTADSAVVSTGHIATPNKLKYVMRTIENTTFSSSGIKRCEMDGCNSVAMPHSSLCYTHNTK